MKNKQDLSKIEINKESFAHWFTIAAISKHAKDIEVNAFPTVPGWEDLTWNNCVVEFKINDVDVNFIGMMTRIKDAFDEQVKEAAKELVKEKLDSIETLFNDMRDYTINELAQETYRE